MDRPSNEIGNRPSDALKASVDYATRSRAGLAEGLKDARSARLDAPRPGEHARRFVYGFALPLSLLRVAWRSSAERRKLVSTLRAPIACVALATCIGVVWIAQGVAHPEPIALHASAHIGDDGKDDGDDDDDKQAKDDKPVKDDGITVVNEGPVHLRFEPPKIEPPKPPLAAAAIAPAPRGLTSTLRAVFDVLTSRVVQVFATLGVLEWILVWIGREHHDQIAYDTSVLTGVPGEALGRPPRLRLDAGWLWMKLWRTVRFLFFLSLSGPVVWLVGRIPVAGGWIGVAIEAAWGAYWASVFAIANSFLAWEPIPEGAAPWFIRVMQPLARVPLVGVPVRMCARVLTIATRKVWPACLAFEGTTWESAGLAAVRALASVPFVYLVMRPMFGPAATHAFVARHGAPADTP